MRSETAKMVRKARKSIGVLRHRATVYRKNSRPSGRLDAVRGYIEGEADVLFKFYGSLETFDPEDPWLNTIIDLTDQRNTPTHVMECRLDKNTNQVKREVVISTEDKYGTRYFDIVGRQRLNERGERLVLLLRLKHTEE